MALSEPHWINVSGVHSCQLEWTLSVPVAPFLAAIGERREPPKERPGIAVRSCIPMVHEPPNGLQSLVELPDEVLCVVVRVREVEVGMAEVGAEFLLRFLEPLDHHGGGWTPECPSVRRELHETLRGLFDGVRLDHPLDHPNEDLEPLPLRMAYRIIRRKERSEAFDEMAGAELVDDLRAVHESGGSRNICIPVRNDCGERIPDRLELPEVHDPLDSTFFLHEVMVREVSGAIIHPDKPALLVHPGDLVLGELRLIHSFDDRVIDAHDLPIDGEDAGPLGKIPLRDLERVWELRADAADDPHDRILRLPIPSGEDANGGAFEGITGDALRDVVMHAEVTERSEGADVRTVETGDPLDRPIDR